MATKAEKKWHSDLKKELREDRKKLVKWRKEEKQIAKLIKSNEKALKKLKKQGWLK